MDRAAPIGVGALHLGSSDGHESKIFEMISRYSKNGGAVNSGLEFVFDHTPISAIQDNSRCTHLKFRTSSGETINYPTDLVISCTGYISQHTDLAVNLPVLKVGWIARGSRGTLADSMIDSQGALRFVKSLQQSNELRDLDEYDTENNKKKLEDFWLYENAMSSLLGRPWSYPEVGNEDNFLTHQFLEKLTRY